VDRGSRRSREGAPRGKIVRIPVTALDAKALGEFRTEADKLAVTMRGGMVPADVYDLAVQARDEYRKSHGN